MPRTVEAYKKKEQICITMETYVLSKVRVLADRRNRSISYVINQFTKDGLKENKATKLVRRKTAH